MLDFFTRVVTTAVENPAYSPWPLLRDLEVENGPHAVTAPLLAFPSMQHARMDLSEDDDAWDMRKKGYPRELPLASVKVGPVHAHRVQIADIGQ